MLDALHQEENWDDASAPVSNWLAKLRDAQLGELRARVQTTIDGDAFRTAVVAALKRKNMSVAEATRRAGMHSPSALRNLLSHRSESLRYPTALRLAQVLEIDVGMMSGAPAIPAVGEIDAIAQLLDQPGAPAEVRLLMTRLRDLVRAIAAPAPALPAALEAELLMIKVIVDNEGPRTALTLAPELQVPLAGRITPEDAVRLAFGVRIVGRAAEPAYSPGTILVCVPTSEFRAFTPQAGRRVLACYRAARKTPAWREFNVGVFEIVGEEAGGWQMAPLGRAGVTLLEMPDEIYKAPWTSRGFDVKVAGVVVSSIISEEGQRL